MAWIDSRYLDQQRKLEREILQLRREWDELKLEIAPRRTAARREAKAARIAFEKLWHDLQLSAEQKAGFNPDQPRDDHGKWTDSGRDAGKDGPRLVSEPAAMRRGGPRAPATPAQRARLAIADARAREAVARVRQLDPSWRPQSAMSHDNRDFEVMIRAKEAERQEAEARFMALSRAREDGPYTSPEPRTFREILTPSSGEKIRTVNPAEFETIRTNLMVGARQIEPGARYDGVWYKREDGAIFGLRLSARHGLTLDVIRSSHPDVPPSFKVHQR